MRPEAGQGSGWEQLARQVADVVPPEEVDALWVFPVRRQDQREFGTAVLTRPGSSHSLKQTGKEDLVVLINYEVQPRPAAK